MTAFIIHHMRQKSINRVMNDEKALTRLVVVIYNEIRTHRAGNRWGMRKTEVIVLCPFVDLASTSRF